MDTLERLVCRITGARRATRGSKIQSLWGGYGELLKMELVGIDDSSVVVKHVQPPMQRSSKSTDSARSHARKLRSYAVEAAWYEQYAPRCDERCRVPRSIGQVADEGNWLFVLEDLDVAGFPRRATFPKPDEVRAVLSWLAAFHATFIGTKPTGLWSVGTYWHLATRPEELQRLRDPVLRDAAAKFDARLNSSKYRTILHGDAKSDNFCFSSKGESSNVAAVDYQYTGGGCGMKDVAYFFSSIWSSAECEAFAAAALDYYFEHLRGELAMRSPQLDGRELESEWRGLYPVAWADFQRFLGGWAPGQYDHEPYAERMVRAALQHL